jgi:hypothetical protein
VFIHHTGGRNDYTRDQTPALIRGIYRYHVFTRRYRDIAYNFLIDRYGQIFEGRFGGVREPVVGAHTEGFNTASTGIAMIGNFGSGRPPAAMLRSLRYLLPWKLDVHHVPPVGTVLMTSGGNERYPRGTVVRFARISGHRNAKSTSCPGAYLYGLLPNLRSAADAAGHPKIYLPRFDAAVVRPDGDGANETTTFTATFTRDVGWTLQVTDGSGAVVRTWNGSGSSVSEAGSTGVRWDGTDASGLLLSTGRYRWRLDARQATGALALPASGFVYPVNQHPDGTVLRDQTGRYVLTGLQSTDLPDDVVYRSNFGSLAPVATGPGERARYVPSPVPIALRDGALLENFTDGSRWIWSGGTLRRFWSDPAASPPVDVFGALGYNPAALIAASPEFLVTLAPGTAVTDTGLHPQGSIVRDPSTAALFVIGACARRPASELAMRTRYRPEEVVAATSGDLSLLVEEASPVSVRAGALVAATDGGAPWIILDGEKRRFADAGLYSAMGYSSAMLVRSTQADLDAIPTGAPLG